jgi:hypothetical protein
VGASPIEVVAGAGMVIVRGPPTSMAELDLKEPLQLTMNKSILSPFLIFLL